MICFYCGDETFGYDHLIPHSFLYSHKRKKVSYGGHSVPKIPCCRQCNTVIGNKLLSLVDRLKTIRLYLLKKRTKLDCEEKLHFNDRMIKRLDNSDRYILDPLCVLMDHHKCALDSR